ncbi:MAG: UDP-3-O-acyl-N-acetylglucosamine deacetylase [Myxococcota bacterium]
MRQQHTLCRSTVVCGIGLHSGARVSATLRPAPANSGVTFFDGGAPDAPGWPARFDQVTTTRLATTLGNGPHRVSTVEHLMAALLAEEIDNVEIVVTGNEIPVLDGSAAQWVTMLREVGRQVQPAPRRRLVIRRPVEVREGMCWARLSPREDAGLTLTATIAFDHPRIGTQTLSMRLGSKSFAEQLSWARTFGFLRDVERLRSAGLARGGSLENVVVYDENDVVNPEGLRGADEAIRHKLLDMVGDLALVGCPVEGHFEAHRPGHALNHRLVNRLFEIPDAWEVREG